MAARLTVWNRNEIVLEESVTVGRPGEPTPMGLFFVTDILEFPEHPTGPNNCFHDATNTGYFFITSAFREFPLPTSCIYPEVELVGLAGDSLAVLGTASTHGAIGVSEGAMTRLANMIRVGVPVEIAP